MNLARRTPPEASVKSIEEILRDVRNGKVRLPQFQRNFRWEQKDILDLFDSIYRGYPIGSLLFWATDKHTEGTAALFGGVSFLSWLKGEYLLVVDGQQRMTSLVATLLRDKEPTAPGEEDFYIFFDLDSSTFMIPTLEQGPNPAWLPLNKIADTVQYLEWIQALPPGPERDPHVRAADRVVRAIRDYTVPVYIVHSDDEDEVRTIFKRLNTSGKPLKYGEVFRAIRDSAHIARSVPFRLLSCTLHDRDDGRILTCEISVSDNRTKREPRLRFIQEESWVKAVYATQPSHAGPGKVTRTITDVRLSATGPAGPQTRTCFVDDHGELRIEATLPVTGENDRFGGPLLARTTPVSQNLTSIIVHFASETAEHSVEVDLRHFEKESTGGAPTWRCTEADEDKGKARRR